MLASLRSLSPPPELLAGPLVQLSPRVYVQHTASCPLALSPVEAMEEPSHLTGCVLCANTTEVSELVGAARAVSDALDRIHGGVVEAAESLNVDDYAVTALARLRSETDPVWAGRLGAAEEDTLLPHTCAELPVDLRRGLTRLWKERVEDIFTGRFTSTPGSVLTLFLTGSYVDFAPELVVSKTPHLVVSHDRQGWALLSLTPSELEDLERRISSSYRRVKPPIFTSHRSEADLLSEETTDLWPLVLELLLEDPSRSIDEALEVAVKAAHG